MMKSAEQAKQETHQLVRWNLMLLVALLVALAVPYVTALGTASAAGATSNADQSTSNNLTTINVSGEQLTITAAAPANKTTASGKILSATSGNQGGSQAKAASSYLASRAATGLQLKNKPNGGQPATGAGASGQNPMGDPIGLDTAIDSQMDLQTAAGEHKKYILVKKKPKHKKIKMEVYKPKMKYKKIKMKIPVKKMKKKKVKGYLVKKEHHHYEH